MKTDLEAQIEELKQQHTSDRERLLSEHKAALDKIEEESEGGKIKLREEM